MRALSGEQAAFLERRLAEHLEVQPAFARLVDKLLALEGVKVVPPPRVESDLDALLARGCEWEASSRLVRGEPSQCHRNVAVLYMRNPQRFRIVTGYALSDDGLWRQHSWIHDTSRLRSRQTIETTERRIRYFGVALNEEEARAFVAGNA
jgi:hypothetical protein